MINLGVVQFSVRSRPDRRDRHARHRRRGSRRSTRCSAACWSTRRTETDVIDVGYTAYDPITAQRDRERDRAGVPVAQRPVGARAVAAPAGVPGRAVGPDRQHAGAGAGGARQLPQPPAARQQSPTSSRRSRSTRSSSRPAWPSSTPTGGPSARLQQQLKSSDEATRAQAIRALGTAPAMADNAAIGGDLPSAAELPGPARLDDDRSLAGVRQQSRRRSS